MYDLELAVEGALECSFRVVRSCGFHAETQRKDSERMLGKDLERQNGVDRGCSGGPGEERWEIFRITTLKSSDASGEGEAVYWKIVKYFQQVSIPLIN